MANPRSRRPFEPANCKAVGCQHQVVPGKLMCADHWRMVPVARQRDVWTSWRELKRGAYTQEKVQRYRAAVQAAVDAVHAKAVARKASRDEQTKPLF